jgi:cytochrome d ubiquinol oxidase subunit II
VRHALFAWSALRGLGKDSGVQTFVSSVGLFLLCFLGLGISVYPYIVPPTVTLSAAAAAPESQIFMLVGVVFLLPIILAYTVFVYWTFSGRLKPGEGYH